VHFYGAAAQTMRRVLVDHAREHLAHKRGGALETVVLDENIDAATTGVRVDILALDQALTQLAAIAPDRARVVELRFFGGLSVEETATLLGVSPASVKRHWSFARAWLFRALNGS
jgi:RNA polymerase sigma factor (TIGR02999 family)